MKLPTAVTVALFASAWSTETLAQTSVDERHAELKMVVETINDPDPLMRLAQLEAILAGNDATKTQLALRTAFTVDDPNVRSLALRAHFSSYRTVVIEAELPNSVKQALETGGENAQRTHTNTQSLMNDISGKFTLETEENPTLNEDFTFISVTNNSDRDERYSGTGNIKGTTITLAGKFIIGIAHVCSFQLHEYEGFIVKGSGSCGIGNGGGVPFPVSIRLF